MPAFFREFIAWHRTSFTWLWVFCVPPSVIQPFSCAEVLRANNSGRMGGAFLDDVAVYAKFVIQRRSRVILRQRFLKMAKLSPLKAWWNEGVR